MSPAKVFPHPLPPEQEIVLWSKYCQKCITNNPDWKSLPVRCPSRRDCPSWVNYEMREDDEHSEG